MSNIQSYPDRAAWLSARRHGIGGSDVPAILGISPWRTPLQVWSEKVGLAEESEESYTLRRGSHMEALLAEELVREVPDLVIVDRTPWSISTHGTYDWLAYSPDAIAARPGETVLVEFKSHPRGASEWSESIPEHVAAQVQHGMEVMDLPAAYVGVDLGTEFRWARVDRDRDWYAAQLPVLRDFWRNVESESPPAPTGDEGDRAVLARMWPREDPGKVRAITGDMLSTAERLLELEADAKIVENEMETIKNELRAYAGDAERLVLPDGSGWTNKTQSRPKMIADPSGARSESRVLRRVGAKKER